MDINTMYVGVMEVMAPVLTLSGWLAFTISCIVMLVNMIINASTGKGFNIGLK